MELLREQKAESVRVLEDEVIQQGKEINVW